MDGNPQSAKWTLALQISFFLGFLFFLSSPFWIYQVQQYTHREKISSCLNQDWVSQEPAARQPSVSMFCKSYVAAHESKARLSHIFKFLGGKVGAAGIVATAIGDLIYFRVTNDFTSPIDHIPSWYVESIDGIGLAVGIIKKDDLFPDLHEDYEKSRQDVAAIHDKTINDERVKRLRATIDKRLKAKDDTSEKQKSVLDKLNGLPDSTE